MFEGEVVNKDINVLGLQIANVSYADLMKSIDTYRFVVPVNVDVLMKYARDEEFRDILEQRKDEALIVQDSQVMIWAIRHILGKKFVARISGSELLPQWCKSVNGDEQFFFLGGMDGVAELARARVNSSVGNEVVVGAYSPSYGFERNARECERIIETINSSGASIVAIGVGAPKQEKWMYKYADRMPRVKTFIAVGATIDMMAGKVRKAPSWISNAGLEWLYRLLQEPRRLAKRYLVDDLPFFWLLLKQRFGQNRGI